MNDKELYCYVDMFGPNKIEYADGSNESIGLPELAQYLNVVCYNRGLNRIHFFGNEEYIMGIVDDFREQMNVNYSLGHITVEVN